MKDIEFRAWNPDQKRFEYLNVINKHSLMTSLPIPSMGRWDGLSDFQQFTGLIDKNKNKIYEDDIIRYPDYIKYLKGVNKKDCYSVGKIVYDASCYWVWNNGYRSAIPWMFTPTPGGSPALSSNDFEVIGNIYENPELLNSDQKMKA